jgi:hypothetical protein
MSQEQDELQKAQLIITALQQRIGEITGEYEVRFALLRAEFTMLQDMYQNLEKTVATEEYNKQIAKKISK